MKARVQYDDFIGTAAADISDFIGSKYGDNLESFGRYFKIDESRFKVIGLSVFWTNNFYISFLCVDKRKSTEVNDHIVSMSIVISDEIEILELLFKRLNVVLHSKYDNKYPSMKYVEEINYSDYHQIKDKE